MADVILATVTGTIYRNTADGSPAAPWVSAAVRFAPAYLDETMEIADSQSTVHVVTTGPSGALIAYLWPGTWRATLPDGETFPFNVAAGGTYNLRELRGYVPPPGVVARTVALTHSGPPARAAASGPPRPPSR